MGEYLLKQDDFKLSSCFEELRSAGELLDVTLASSDEIVKAHKVVLSAYSPFFREVLSNAEYPHPIIFLKGLGKEDLRSIIDYLYTGQTQIGQKSVKRFLEIATELKIKGLIEKTQKIEESNNKKPELKDIQSDLDVDNLLNKSTSPHQKYDIEPTIINERSTFLEIEEQRNHQNQPSSSKSKEHTSENNFETENNYKDCEQVINKQDCLKNPSNENSSTETDKNNCSNGASQSSQRVVSTKSKVNVEELIASRNPDTQQILENLQKHLKEQKPNAFGKFSCPNCDYEGGDRRAVKQHFTSRHLGIVYKCGKCPKILSSQSGLKSHVEIMHDQFSGSWILQQ